MIKTSKNANADLNNLEDGNKQRKNIQNLGNLVSQKIEVTNLHENFKAYKKYVKKRVKCRRWKLSWVHFRSSSLRSNTVIDVRLNKFEEWVYKFLLITFYFVGW